MKRATDATKAPRPKKPEAAAPTTAETSAAYRERLLVRAELMGTWAEFEAAVTSAKQGRVIDAGPAEEALEALKEVFLNLADAVPIRRTAG